MTPFIPTVAKAVRLGCAFPSPLLQIAKRSIIAFNVISLNTNQSLLPNLIDVDSLGFGPSTYGHIPFNGKVATPAFVSRLFYPDCVKKITVRKITEI